MASQYRLPPFGRHALRTYAAVFSFILYSYSYSQSPQMLSFQPPVPMYCSRVLLSANYATLRYRRPSVYFAARKYCDTGWSSPPLLSTIYPPAQQAASTLVHTSQLDSAPLCELLKSKARLWSAHLYKRYQSALCISVDRRRVGKWGLTVLVRRTIGSGR